MTARNDVSNMAVDLGARAMSEAMKAAWRIIDLAPSGMQEAALAVLLAAMEAKAQAARRAGIALPAELVEQLAAGEYADLMARQEGGR